jgi:hypothetical protein
MPQRILLDPRQAPAPGPSKTSFDKPEDVEHLYFTAADKQWLVDHWATQTAKGNGFAAPQLTEDSKSVPTLTARYQQQKGEEVRFGSNNLPERQIIGSSYRIEKSEYADRTRIAFGFNADEGKRIERAI